MKKYLEENNMKKKSLRKALGAISNMAGVKIKKSMLKRFNGAESDELVMTPVAVKSVLGQMGYRITSLEVREGDSAVFSKNKWKVTSDVANHTNKLIGIFTILASDSENISNFTPISYIDKVKEMGGESWEDWYDENAKSAALRHTLKASTIAFLAKPILSRKKGSTEKPPIESNAEFSSLVDQLMMEVGEVFTDKKTDETLDIPEVIIPVAKTPDIVPDDKVDTAPDEKFPDVESTEETPEIVETVLADDAGDSTTKEEPSQEIDTKEEPTPVLKNLSRKNWMIARDEIEERFHAGESKESLQEDARKLELVKPKGIKDEKIVLDEVTKEDGSKNDTEDVPVNPEPISEPKENVVTEPIVESVVESTIDTEEVDTSTPFDPIETIPEADKPMSADDWVKSHRELDKRWQDGEFGEEINSEAKLLLEKKPSSVAGTILIEDSFLHSKEVKDKEGEKWRESVKEWKEWKADIEYRWRKGQVQSEIDAEVKELNASIPDGFGAGVVKIGKAWESERLQEPKVDKELIPEPKSTASTEETPPVPSSSGLTPKVFEGSYDEPMSVREWMGAYGNLERRRKEEGRNWELFHSAEIIDRRRPEQIKPGMLNMSNYEVTGEEK